MTRNANAKSSYMPLLVCAVRELSEYMHKMCGNGWENMIDVDVAEGVLAIIFDAGTTCEHLLQQDAESKAAWWYFTLQRGSALYHTISYHIALVLSIVLSALVPHS